MKFDPALGEGLLLRRYKRFLADIQLSSGEIITIHCPNTGSMKNCWLENTPCWFSDSGNAKRKYRHTLEITTTPEGALAGVNTGRANALVEEAIHSGVIRELQGYDSLRREVKYGEENSRIDLLLSRDDGDCYVEVKNVTLAEGARGMFPDAVSVRGAKHLRELQIVLCRAHQTAAAREVHAVHEIREIVLALEFSALPADIPGDDARIAISRIEERVLHAEWIEDARLRELTERHP